MVVLSMRLLGTLSYALGAKFSYLENYICKPLVLEVLDIATFAVVTTVLYMVIHYVYIKKQNLALK
jgi:hypothetical protein